MGSLGSGSLMMGGVGGGPHVPLSEQQDYISVDVNGLSDITNQSHLTKVRNTGEREEMRVRERRGEERERMKISR